MTSDRKRLPTDRQSITHKVNVAGFKFIVTAGMYDDGTLGEIFIKEAGKEGSTIQGLLDSFATGFSLCLQKGYTLDELVLKFAKRKFEPNGMTDNPHIPHTRSPVDYIMQWLASRFGSPGLQAELEAMNFQEQLR